LLPAGFFVDRECPISCQHSEPEPDIAVFSGNIEDYESSHPTTAELVIEVAINTQQRDRIKAGIYAGAGVKEYWLIEPEAGLVTLHTQPQGDAYECVRSFQPDEEAVSTVFPGFSLRLAELMA
jgi:Uma2 family endonuclease